MFVYGTVQLDLGLPGEMEIDLCLRQKKVENLFDVNSLDSVDRPDLMAVEFELMEKFKKVEKLVKAAQKESSMYFKGEGQSFAIAGTRAEAKARFLKGE